ncbi:uncharacterized protein TNIN_171781 [Trichonephila inaurata madagascariensis]|uniref:DUF19 domain-containing protein n=1 Tax=Trichonephila inaurata madagascariensis TaxID=2747483 RepID=A0A8X6XKR5_9ARAC|nr:uncharacterized protein TNIN_171781 [Trichonephila inaurata madagascariensis]
MDKIFFLFLFGIAAVAAAPSCSEEEALKCGSLGDRDWRGHTWPENEEELNKACSNVEPILDCQIDFVQRCPKSDLSLFAGYLKESKILYGKLCKESNFRTKFLKNVPCLNHESVDFNICRNKFTVEGSGGFCAYNFDVLQCALNMIKEKCGEEALHVFDALYKPLISIDKIFCRKDD